MTCISHMADVQLFGMKAGAHHQVNVAFHVINTLLVFWLFRRMTAATAHSAFAAALFAFEQVNLGNPAAAVAAADEALRRRSDDVVSLTNLIVARWGMGDAPSARRSFERLKAVDPSAAASLAARVDFLSSDACVQATTNFSWIDLIRTVLRR